jgi:hypothetical protein
MLFARARLIRALYNATRVGSLDAARSVRVNSALGRWFSMSKRSKSIHSSSTAPSIGLALCLLIPSTGTIQKYFGTQGALAYILVGLPALLLILRWILPTFISNLTEKQAFWLALLTFFFLVLAFAVLYPIANSGTINSGSYADEALNIAASELLHGRYPYYQKTYLGNLISPLPGAILFAAPFVLLGNSAYQNLFWLAVFFIFAIRYFKGGVLALTLLWIILVFSPSVLQNLVTGVDYLANTIYVLLLMWWVIRSVSDGTAPAWRKIISSALLGIGLSSRSNFLLLTPLLFSALVQNAGWKPAIKYTVVMCLSFLAVTIPFWLYDPQGFTPLIQQTKKVAQYPVLPFGGIIIPSVAGVIALALSFQRMNRDNVTLFRNCAIVQAFPVLCVIILSSLQAGSLFLILSGYGIFFLFFGALAFYTKLIQSTVNVNRLNGITMLLTQVA